MDALTLLHERSSMGKLTEPAPSADQLSAIYQAALRAQTIKSCAPGGLSNLSVKGASAWVSCLQKRNFKKTPVPVMTR